MQKENGADKRMKGMTLIVKTIAGWIKGLIFLFGIYIILFGHHTPGGGFAGGVILASSYVLLMLAFGKEFVEENLSAKSALSVICLAAFAFGMIAISGLFISGDAFFSNWIYQKYIGLGSGFKLMETGNIALAEIAIALKVAASLFLVVFLLSIFKPQDLAAQKD